MVVPSLGCLEHRLVQCQPRLCALFGKGHGGEQFVAWMTVGVLPCKGEDDALRLDDFAIDAALPVLGAVRRSHAEAVGTADADVHFAVDGCEALWPPPAREVFRLGPGPEHQPTRCIDDARHDEFAIRCGANASG